MDLQITGLEEQDVVQAAAVKFPGKYIEMGERDLYLPDIEKQLDDWGYRSSRICQQLCL